METILIIEDDPTLLRGLKDNFAYAGYGVRTASDGEAGLAAALDLDVDVIILDIMLPKVNGYELCRLVRKEKVDVPIIMLTAKGEEADIVLGLNLGADDYVTKPFSIKELLARVAAFLRRRKEAERDRYEFGDFVLDKVGKQLFCEGKPMDLSPKEFRLLEYFVKNHGRALTRDEILNNVWGFNCFVTQRSIDRCITTLRNKIEPETEQPRFIHTIRSIGYKFDPVS